MLTCLARSQHLRQKSVDMPVTRATPFQCPTCGAKYKLVRVETKELVPDQQMTCRRCGSPLRGGEGRFVLKYFLLPHRSRRRTRAGDN